jgi:class 3 adenylate cyclase
MFERVTRLVRQHGGTVDRSLGDGLLAYFTPDDGTAMLGGHADRALACGVAILRAQVQDMLVAAAQPQSFVLPLRIGINSGNVYIGDLGSDERRDFTIIGSAVNFGQRLEAACEINRIMVGEATMALSTLYSATTPGMQRRPIIAKSYHEPVNAYEFDPFIDTPKEADAAVAAYRAFAQIVRSEERLPCESASLVIATSSGFASIVNVSRSGLLLRLETFAARGATIRAEGVTAGIEHLAISPFFLEVRWAVAAAGGTFLHGCMIKSLDEEQKAELWKLWTGAVAQAELQSPV